MSYLHGKFVWFEHLSADAAKARKFYDALFGWHTEATPMGGPEPYPLIMNGSEGIGGFRAALPGLGSQWLAYLSVADVDKSHAAALKAGAKSLMPPTDFGPVGRGAALADPTGAVFAIWKGAEGDRADVETTPDGDWYWNELMTDDEKAALAFYSGTFGLKHEVMNMGEQGDYYILKAGDKMRGGLMHKPMPDAPTAWTPYVKVADCDASVAAARRLGAQVMVEPTDIPNIGRFATVVDPLGAVIAFMKPAQ